MKVVNILLLLGVCFISANAGIIDSVLCIDLCLLNIFDINIVCATSETETEYEFRSVCSMKYESCVANTIYIVKHEGKCSDPIDCSKPCSTNSKPVCGLLEDGKYQTFLNDCKRFCVEDAEVAYAHPGKCTAEELKQE